MVDATADEDQRALPRPPPVGPLLLGIEGDTDADGLVVLGEDLVAEEGGHERGHALGAVDEDALAD